MSRPFFMRGFRSLDGQDFRNEAWKKRYSKYLESEHWAKLSSAVLLRDDYRCTKCGTPNNLQAHHLKYRDRFQDSVPEDLITLCTECHKNTHFIKSKGTSWSEHLDEIEARGFPLSKEDRHILNDLKRFCSRQDHESRRRANRLINLSNRPEAAVGVH